MKYLKNFNESLEDHIIDDENTLDPSEQNIKDQFYKWYDSIDYTEADYTSFKAGYKIAQVSKLPKERESLDDRIAIEFRRRYGDIRK
jgi:hypothetical protein